MHISKGTQMSLLPDEEIGGDALIKGCYRYQLRRWWGANRKMLVWILLNPSTADAENDDATLRRVIFYSKREGYNRWGFGNNCGLTP